MNINMTGVDVFKSLRPCALDKSSLSIGKVDPYQSSLHIFLLMHVDKL